MLNRHLSAARTRARIVLALTALAVALGLTQGPGASATERDLADRVSALEERLDALTETERLVGGSDALVGTHTGHHLSDRCDPPRADPYLECYWEQRAEEAR